MNADTPKLLEVQDLTKHFVSKTGKARRTVHAVVDFIDGTTFEVERKRMAVPICHTDGCGMILPQLSGGCPSIIPARFSKKRM